MSFHNAATPEDLPQWSQGEPICEADLIVDEPRDVVDAPTETRDTAVTDWIGGRQPVLEPVEALLGGTDEPQ
jgi:hypothetical protein